MPKDYSNQNLQAQSFAGQQLIHANFHGADIRGADFDGANLTGADFSQAKTGINPANVAWIFAVAVVVSLFSGFLAALAGKTLQTMLANTDDPNIHGSAYVSIAIIVLFIIYSFMKGVGKAIYSFIFPITVVALLIGITARLTGTGTGMGMVYLIGYCFLVAVMFVVGSMARVVGGVLSSTVLFMIVALGGGMFGKSIGGGIGSVVMALSCAMISKRALKGAPGFDTLRKLANSITKAYGTSFRNASLVNVDLTGAKLTNCDFTGADLQGVNWEGIKRQNCIQS